MIAVKDRGHEVRDTYDVVRRKQQSASPFDVPVSKVVRGRLKTVSEAAPGAALETVFRDPDVEHVAVVDARGRGLGVVSRMDYQLRASAETMGAAHALLDSSVIPVEQDLTLQQASALMVRRGLSGLLVRCADGFACVRASDVVRFVAGATKRQ